MPEHRRGSEASAPTPARIAASTGAAHASPAVATHQKPDEELHLRSGAARAGDGVAGMRHAVRGPAASGRARRRRPGRGTPPTPRACCAGRSRRRARPASRRAARSPRRPRSRRTGCFGSGSMPSALALALGERPDVVLGLARQLVALLDALHAGGEHDGVREVGVARRVDGAQLDAGRLALVGLVHRHPDHRRAVVVAPADVRRRLAAADQPLVGVDPLVGDAR